MTSNEEIHVVVVADKTEPATYTVIVMVPGIPPYTTYEVPLSKVAETIRARQGEVMQ